MDSDDRYCYSKIILLGSGKLAYQCAAESRKYLENVEVLEYRVTDSTILEKMCQKDGMKYRQCGKEELSETLRGEKERTLIVSAGNTYIFPRDIIEKDHLTIVNWHNALLPRHKGRNAEAWCIYEGDRETGITWHRIVEAVDAGDILAQEKIDIDDSTTALALFGKQCDLGAEVFGRILESLLEGTCVSRRQAQIQTDGTDSPGESQPYPRKLSSHEKHSSHEKSASHGMHYSYERPNGGELDMEWPFEKMSRFLRAMDYGSLQLLGEMRVVWEGERYRFHKYKIQESGGSEGIAWQGRDLLICRDGREILLRDLRKE